MGLCLGQGHRNQPLLRAAQVRRPGLLDVGSGPDVHGHDVVRLCKGLECCGCAHGLRLLCGSKRLHNDEVMREDSKRSIKRSNECICAFRCRAGLYQI
eukprot:scaffold236223_cov46-Prasinocladus_malaysianus.AAC.1